MRKSITRILIVIIILCCVSAGAVTWIYYGNETAGDELVLYGNVDIRQVELAFIGNERIADILVEEGETVQKGQLLATLDMQRFRYKVALAEARYKSQQQIVARLEAGTRPEKIREAKANLAAAQAKAVDARRTFDRVKALTVDGAMTAEDLDDALSAKENAIAQVQATQAALDLAVAGPRKEDIATAKAELRAREAELKLARRNLADASLYAPSDGVIQDRLLEIGDMASPQKAVFTIALKTPLWIRVYVDEPDLGKIAPGMTAMVKTDSYPGKNLSRLDRFHFSRC